MPSAPDNSGICPLGTVPIPNADGTVSCWDPTEPGYPGPPSQGQKPEPNPSSPAGGAQPPVRAPTLPIRSPVLPRQPGAPAVPYTPPGRISLFGGPIFGSGSSGTSTFTQTGAATVGGAVLGEGPIFVDVSQAVNLADNSAASAIGSVAAAVNGAISEASTIANNVALLTQQQIAQSLLGTAGAITQGVGQVFQGLLGGLHDLNTSISGALGDIGSTIGNDLVATLNPVLRATAEIITIIQQQLGGLAGNVAKAVSVIIPEIVKAVSDPIGLVTDVLHKIENDIGTNLDSLTKIPGAIADASTSLDATLRRTLSSYESFVESQTGWGKGHTNHSDLFDLTRAITDGLAGITERVTGFNPKLSDRLTTLCKGVDLDKALQAPVFDPLRVPEHFIPDWHRAFSEIVLWIFSILPAVQKITEESRQRMDESCPIELISPTVLVDAVLRGYLTREQAVTEAAKGNLGESRFQLLQDLATHQMSPGQLVEALYRGIVSESDYNNALLAQGWTGPQQVLLKALGVAQLTVSESLELLRRGSIDSSSLESILKAHAYDDAQRKAIASLTFRPMHTSEAIDFGAASDALNAIGEQADPGIFQPPEFVSVAGQAEGLDREATDAKWLTHWNIGTLPMWVSLFFRSQVTLDTLKAVAAREYVPPRVLDAYIEAQRPLVQFRTISTALRLNLITEDAARALLRQHGYHENNIDLLVKYAQRPGPAKAAKNAQALHSTSLSIAKEEYIDGSITADQYLAILTQHGYTVDGANTELQVVNAHQSLLRRKEAAQLVIDEFGAGLIDEKAALAQLAVLGLTVDELARAAHRIRAFRSKAAKHPTEADLHQFLKNQIITEEDYVAELRAQMYPQKWADAFLAWRTLPGTSTTSGTASQVSAPPGG